MNNWIINTMPTLTSVIQHLTERGIRIISVDSDTEQFFRIHCTTTEEFCIWATLNNATVDDKWCGSKRDDRYPYKVIVWVDGIQCFTLMSEEEYREWRGESESP